MELVTVYAIHHKRKDNKYTFGGWLEYCFTKAEAVARREALCGQYPTFDLIGVEWQYKA